MQNKRYFWVVCLLVKIRIAFNTFLFNRSINKSCLILSKFMRATDKLNWIFKLTKFWDNHIKNMRKINISNKIWIEYRVQYGENCKSIRVVYIYSSFLEKDHTELLRRQIKCCQKPLEDKIQELYFIQEINFEDCTHLKNICLLPHSIFEKCI